MAQKLTLISHKLCPYVQRAVIALNEKGVPFERVDIDLASKPDWFLKISPLGKVPVLVVTGDDGNEVALFESNVICEYIEETLGGAKLHPHDALQRAQHQRSGVPGAVLRRHTAGPGTKSRNNPMQSRMGPGPQHFGRLRPGREMVRRHSPT